MSTQLTEWKPFTHSLLPEMSAMFNEMLRDWPQLPMRMGGGAEMWAPRVNLIESPDTYEVRAELPGCKTEDIKVNLTGNTLCISGEKRKEERRADDHYHVYERSYGAFQRTFNLPNQIDPNSVLAETQDGILIVKIKKAEASKARQIKVEAKKK